VLFGALEMASTEQIAITQRSVEMLHSRAQIAETIAKNQILSGNNNEQMIACAIKRRFDDLYGSSWQCIVGKSFEQIAQRWNLYCVTVALEDSF
uniref:Dynein light chain n=1 Tax=Parascaris univalens TaxID=6257 RepID=A0A915AU86_PARUN